jgi:hypothetical protein
MALEEARSGQAKLRVFASTYTCFTLKLPLASSPSAGGDASSQHGGGEQAVFALCAPNGLPMAKATVRVVSDSAPHVTVGSIHVPVNKVIMGGVQVLEYDDVLCVWVAVVLPPHQAKQDVHV